MKSFLMNSAMFALFLPAFSVTTYAGDALEMAKEVVSPYVNAHLVEGYRVVDLKMGYTPTKRLPTEEALLAKKVGVNGLFGLKGTIENVSTGEQVPVYGDVTVRFLNYFDPATGRRASSNYFVENQDIYPNGFLNHYEFRETHYFVNLYSELTHQPVVQRVEDQQSGRWR